MRRVLTLLLVLLPLSMPPVFPAARPESALDLISIQWQKLGYEIVFMPARPGFRAMTFPSRHRIEVYARSQDNLDLLAYDIAHEIGHAIDVTYNTAETRKHWMESRGIDPATIWFGCDRCSDYSTPAGDFAETFAMYLCGPKYFRGRIASRPTPEEMVILAQFFPKDLLPS